MTPEELTGIIFHNSYKRRVFGWDVSHFGQPVANPLHHRIFAASVVVGTQCTCDVFKDVIILYFTQKKMGASEKYGHSLFTLASFISSAVKRSSYLFLFILNAGSIRYRISKLDQMFAFFFAEKVIKCDCPWRLRQVTPKADRLFLRSVLVMGFGSRVDTHRVINHPLLDRNTFGLIPRSRAYDPFEHGIQFPRQQARGHIVSQWRTASSDIDQIACLTGGCTHSFHVTVICLAICKKRN